jgi:hypothetical protein
MPNVTSSTGGQSRRQRTQRRVSPKKALAEAIRELGPDAAAHTEGPSTLVIVVQPVEQAAAPR